MIEELIRRVEEAGDMVMAELRQYRSVTSANARQSGWFALQLGRPSGRYRNDWDYLRALSGYIGHEIQLMRKRMDPEEYAGYCAFINRAFETRWDEYDRSVDALREAGENERYVNATGWLTVREDE